MINGVNTNICISFDKYQVCPMHYLEKNSDKVCKINVNIKKKNTVPKSCLACPLPKLLM